MRLAHDHRVPRHSQGRRNWPGRRRSAHSRGLVLDLCRMNKILAIRIVDRSVVVQPGVVYADLENALAPYGFFFPLTLQAEKPVPWGQCWPTNAGGIRGAKYGVTRDYVLGLEVVLPDGPADAHRYTRA